MSIEVGTKVRVARSVEGGIGQHFIGREGIAGETVHDTNLFVKFEDGEGWVDKDGNYEGVIFAEAELEVIA